MGLLQILPVENKFFDCFTSSANTLLRAARAMHELLLDFKDVENGVGRITQMEHEGDRIVHQTLELLSHTFLTPMEDDEIRALVSKLDDVLDHLEATARAFLLYQVKEPIPEVVEVSQLLVQLAEQIAAAVPLLADKKRHNEIKAYAVEINRLENEVDRVQFDALARLIQERGDWFELFRWKEIIESLEAAADCCEDVADVLTTVVLKSA